MAAKVSVLHDQKNESNDKTDDEGRGIITKLMSLFKKSRRRSKEDKGVVVETQGEQNHEGRETEKRKLLAEIGQELVGKIPQGDLEVITVAAPSEMTLRMFGESDKHSSNKVELNNPNDPILGSVPASDGRKGEEMIKKETTLKETLAKGETLLEKLFGEKENKEKIKMSPEEKKKERSKVVERLSNEGNEINTVKVKTETTALKSDVTRNINGNDQADKKSFVKGVFQDLSMKSKDERVPWRSERHEKTGRGDYSHLEDYDPPYAFEHPVNRPQNDFSSGTLNAIKRKLKELLEQREKKHFSHSATTLTNYPSKDSDRSATWKAAGGWKSGTWGQERSRKELWHYPARATKEKWTSHGHNADEITTKTQNKSDYKTGRLRKSNDPHWPSESPGDAKSGNWGLPAGTTTWEEDKLGHEGHGQDSTLKTAAPSRLPPGTTWTTLDHPRKIVERMKWNTPAPTDSGRTWMDLPSPTFWTQPMEIKPRTNDQSVPDQWTRIEKGEESDHGSVLEHFMKGNVPRIINWRVDNMPSGKQTIVIL